MTTARYWDAGTGTWKTVSGFAGPQGPAGPLGPPTPAAGPAGGDLTGNYPNPGVDKTKIGGLIAVQRLVGTGAVYRTFSNGQKFFVDAGVTPLQLNYTPAVDCWWEVEAQIGIVQKLDANYHSAFWNLMLTPADADGLTQMWVLDVMRSDVQLYTFKEMIQTWRLKAGIAYSSYASFSMLATGGSWQHYQGPEYLSIRGAAWAL